MRFHRLLICFSIALAFAWRTGVVIAQSTAENANYVGPVLNVNIPTVSFSQIVQNSGYISVDYLPRYIAGLYEYLLGFAAIVTIVMIMIGGVQYVLASGTGNIAAAKKRMVNAVTGLVLLMFAFVILFTVNPQLTYFSALNIKFVTPILIEEDIVANLADCPDVKGTVKKCTATTLTKPSGWTQTLTDAVNAAAASSGVDPILIAAHLQEETGGNVSYGSNTGPCGEIGPSQFMPTTFEAIVGQADCCTAYAAEHVSAAKTSSCNGNVSSSWPPDNSFISSAHCRLDLGCKSCQIASSACIQYFNTSTPTGLTNSITATALLIKTNLNDPKIANDIASEMCAYNGAGKHAAEYAAAAGVIYAEFCTASGGTQ